MNPYVLTIIIFSVILGIVYVVVSLPRTIYLPVADGAQDDIETRKKKAAKVRARTFVFGIGGTIGLCLAVMLIIWVSGPVKTVYGAFNPSATPTITNTVTNTPTRTVTPTPRITSTPGALTAQPTSRTPTGTISATYLTPSGGGGGGGSTIIQTRIVVQTKVVTQVVYIPMTVPVTVLVTSVPATATITPSPTLTLEPSQTPFVITVIVTYTDTPTSTPTWTHTPTETPTPSETPTP